MRIKKADEFLMVLEALQCHHKYFVRCRSMEDQPGVIQGIFRYLQIKRGTTIIISVNSITSPRVYHQVGQGGTTFVVLNGDAE